MARSDERPECHGAGRDDANRPDYFGIARSSPRGAPGGANRRHPAPLLDHFPRSTGAGEVSSSRSSAPAQSGFEEPGPIRTSGPGFGGLAHPGTVSKGSYSMLTNVNA